MRRIRSSSARGQDRKYKNAIPSNTRMPSANDAKTTHNNGSERLFMVSISHLGPMLCHYRRPHGISRRLNANDLQHGKEPALLASLNRRGPGVSAGCLGIVG